jgi:5-(carboxyamino)imidazole ribonucleotide mutase
MSKAADILTEMGIEFEINVMSAHRAPEKVAAYAKGAEGRGIKVLIAGAGVAAHLPGVCASLFKLPVIGVPIYSNALAGADALHSIVQMPPGIPVATVAINGALNAGLLAAQILATSDQAVRLKIKEYYDNMLTTITAKNDRLQEVGYKNY